MKHVDLGNLEEFTQVARNQMSMCAEILTGRDSHPFIEDQPTGERMALALMIHSADLALGGLMELVGSIRDHTPEPEDLIGKLTPSTFTRVGLYREEDGHTYWKEGDFWWGAPTFCGGEPDFSCAGPLADMELEKGTIGELALALDFAREKLLS